MLTKMGPNNNPEAFRTTVERVALVSQWSLELWDLVLAPYRMGQAQLAFCNLDPEPDRDYSWVKTTVLDYPAIREDAHWQHFKAEMYHKGAGAWWWCTDYRALLVVAAPRREL